MSAPRPQGKKLANSTGRKHRSDHGPGRYSQRTLTDKATGLGLRASKLRGRQHRLQCRIAATPKSKVPSDLDYKNYTYARPGSLNVRSR